MLGVVDLFLGGYFRLHGNGVGLVGRQFHPLTAGAADLRADRRIGRAALALHNARRREDLDAVTDSGDRLVRLGEVTHKGIELSLTGQITQELTLVAGTVFLKPRITSPLVAQGLIGETPLGRVPTGFFVPCERSDNGEPSDA